MTPAPAIEARALRKEYGALTALNGVDLSAAPGEVFALLGPNGAGKTTFVEIAEGYRDPSGGEVRVLGADPATGGAAWRSRVGIVLQSAGLFSRLTVREVVNHFAHVYPNPADPAEVIRRVGLEEKADSPCGKLSGGQHRRVDLALGIIGGPELLFLDEPTTGLDPMGRRQTWDVIRDLASDGATILLTTHYLEEAEFLADRVGIISRGQITAIGTPAEIRRLSSTGARVTFERAGNLAGQAFPPLDGDVCLKGSIVTVTSPHPTAVVVALAAWAHGLGVPEIPGLSVQHPTLEDVYLELVGEHIQESPE